MAENNRFRNRNNPAHGETLMYCKMPNNAEQSITSTADDVNAAKERQAFENM